MFSLRMRRRPRETGIWRSVVGRLEAGKRQEESNAHAGVSARQPSAGASCSRFGFLP
jgi:hypothetical protein